MNARSFSERHLLHALCAIYLVVWIVAAINPGPASLAFACSVIFTMLSAQAFDPRLIWDRIEADAVADLPDSQPAVNPAE